MADGAFSLDLVGVSPKSAALACAEMAQKALALNGIRPSAVGAFISQSVDVSSQHERGPTHMTIKLDELCFRERVM